MADNPLAGQIQKVLAMRRFAVVGASRDPEKYGYKVFMSLVRAGYQAYAVNPKADEIEGHPVYRDLGSLPEPPECVVTVVPPAVTEKAVAGALELGVQAVWMQTGSESPVVIDQCAAHGVTCIHSGPCIMVAIRTAKAN